MQSVEVKSFFLLIHHFAFRLLPCPVDCSLKSEAYQPSFYDTEGGEIRVARSASIRQPTPESARLIQRRDTASARQGQRHQRIRRAVRYQRRLQSRLFT